MSINYNALGQRIRSIRRKRGLTQQKLSEQIPCSAPFMSYVENGTKRMSLDMFVCVANELKVSADVLLFDSLENTVSVSNHEFAAVLSDCSEYETRILLDIVRSAKKSMRENKRLLYGFDDYPSSDLEDTNPTIAFQTAWSAPHPILIKLAEMYPEVGFEHTWADEDIGMNCGQVVYENGKQTEIYYPDEAEAVEFANNAWGFENFEEEMGEQNL